MLYATTSLFHFLGSMKFIGEYRDCGSMRNGCRSKDVVQIAIHFMQENLSKTIRLADIAAEVNLSVPISPICLKKRQAPLLFDILPISEYRKPVTTWILLT